MSEDSPKRIAFVISALSGNELKAGNRDVARVYSWLTHPNFGMCQVDGPKPIHECKDSLEFLHIFRPILTNWHREDQLIFYFSGHGDIHNNNYCLKLGVTELDWFPFGNLLNYLDTAKVKRAILIIDACHSGAALEGIRDSGNSLELIKEDDIPRGIAIIASSKKTQSSRELPDGSSGVFTDILCTGIETGLDGKGTEDGFIYIEDIVTYIRDKLEKDKKYSEFAQRPGVSVHNADGKIWIAKTKTTQHSDQENKKITNFYVKNYEDLRILYEQTQRNRHPCLESTIDDLDLELLKQYAQRIEPDLYNKHSIEELLVKLKLYSPIPDGERNVLHKSAVLCFCRRPETIYPQARSTFVVGNPRDSNFIREDIYGPLSNQVKVLVEKVERYFKDKEFGKISYIAEDGLRREVDDIDFYVARELISNAIVHRDYQSTGSVKVQITSEALEVYSPGRFPADKSWDEFVNIPAPVSCPVDEAISQYLLNLLVFEGIGRGFDIFKQYIKDNGSDSITCSELPGPTTYIRVLRRNKDINNINFLLTSPGGETKKLNPPSNIPLSGAPYFVGREDKLEQLHQELQQTDQFVIYAITGMGGVGKTELALQYALRYQHNYPGGLCWFPVRGLDLGTQIVNFARTKLGLTIPDQLEFNQQVEYCWARWPEGTVLIVLDDVVDYQAIHPYLPPAQSRFKVLVTSRHRPGASYRRIDLDVLSADSALELLCRLVGTERIEQELKEAQALSEWLGYLPLGLELVGRYLARRLSLTIAQFQKRLEKQKLAAKALLNSTEQGEMTAQLSVTAAFELSWQDLPPEARKLGCRLSLFAPAPFDWSLVEYCVIQTEGKEEWEEALEELEELRDRFLVNRNLLQLTEQQTYRLHQLIREFFQTKLAQLPEADRYKQSFCQAMVAVAKLIPQTPTQDQIAEFTPAIPHLAEVATVLTDWLRDEDLIWPFVGLERLHQGQGTYDQAELWYQQCLEITTSRLGHDHPHVATSLNNLALLYQSMGRYDQAEPLYQQALEMAKQLLGHDHPLVATSLNNLAGLYYNQGRYDQAEPLYKQALEMTKQLLGEKHPSVATSLNNLAALYRFQGRYDQAEPLYQKALEIRKQLLGENHPSVATSLNNLAALYKYLGRYDQAEPLYMKALEMTKKLLGQNHPSVVNSLNNLALLYSDQGRYDESEPLLVQALQMRKLLLDEEHPDVAQSLNNLAFLYKSQGHYHQAEPLYVQALEIAERKLGSNHPDTVIIRNNLESLRDDR